MNEVERQGSAKAREQVARKHGDLKVFMSYDEAALIVASLTWLKADLAQADAELQSLTLRLVKEDIPQNTFTMLTDVIESTQKSIILHAKSDISEQNVENGNEELRQRFEHMGSTLQMMQLLRNQLELWSLAEKASKQAKE